MVLVELVKWAFLFENAVVMCLVVIAWNCYEGVCVRRAVANYLLYGKLCLCAGHTIPLHCQTFCSLCL